MGNNKKNHGKFLGVLSMVAIAVASAPSANAQGMDKNLGAKKEKCYGIVKAGMNDCAAADGSHSCAGLAKNDGDGKEWVLLPAGTCKRIIGGLEKPRV